jgi:hypothetical protein
MVTPALLSCWLTVLLMNAQRGTDLPQCPALGVQVRCTLNVHRATVTSLFTPLFYDRRSIQVPPQRQPHTPIGLAQLGGNSTNLAYQPYRKENITTARDHKARGLQIL